eukprot:Platyproteum_vivax@DN12728_c0_g1_i1.p1
MYSRASLTRSISHGYSESLDSSTSSSNESKTPLKSSLRKQRCLVRRKTVRYSPGTIMYDEFLHSGGKDKLHEKSPKPRAIYVGEGESPVHWDSVMHKALGFLGLNHSGPHSPSYIVGYTSPSSGSGYRREDYSEMVRIDTSRRSSLPSYVKGSREGTLTIDTDIDEEDYIMASVSEPVRKSSPRSPFPLPRFSPSAHDITARCGRGKIRHATYPSPQAILYDIYKKEKLTKEIRQEPKVSPVRKKNSNPCAVQRTRSVAESEVWRQQSCDKPEYLHMYMDNPDSDEEFLAWQEKMYVAWCHRMGYEPVSKSPLQ